MYDISTKVFDQLGVQLYDEIPYIYSWKGWYVQTCIWSLRGAAVA